ncbi:MAG: dTDP-4-dehydrorhamnose 3,5-epimerase [Halobacteriales archaeon]|nr:dTDP-4-dehydrorhamnose 3,5-epimerase [Halobacteriales archaeon]
MPAMSYYSPSDPQAWSRAWSGRHLEGRIDHFVCPKGRIKVGIYDDRDDSPTQGELDTFVIGEHNQQVIRIPGDCWHGFKVVGNEQAILINFPTNLYDYEDPGRGTPPLRHRRNPYGLGRDTER